MFRQLLQGITRRIPSQCAVCHAWPAQAVCEACVAEFAQPVFRCPTCALPLNGRMHPCGECQRHPPPWDSCLAAVHYAYPWSRLMVEFKFREQTAWATTFATLMRATPWIEPALENADLLIPLPLSDQRLRERGFNQTLLLARALSPDKVDARLLLRTRNTPAQHTLSRKDRLANMRLAFAVEPLRREALHGKRVVLLDDVMTSGATLRAAADVLRQAGASHLTTMVFARTPSSEADPDPDWRE